MVVLVAQLVARQTNNWRVVGSIPENTVCITVAWGKLSAVAGHHSLSWSLRLSAFDGLGSGMGKW